MALKFGSVDQIGTRRDLRWTFHTHLFGALQSTIFGWIPTSSCLGYCHL